MKSREIDKLKPKIVKILKKNHVVRAGIFGSYAKGTPKKNSDIDILVKIKSDISLIGVIGLEMKLEGILNKKVDLVEYDAIHPLLKKNILKDEVRII